MVSAAKFYMFALAIWLVENYVCQLYSDESENGFRELFSHGPLYVHAFIWHPGAAVGTMNFVFSLQVLLCEKEGLRYRVGYWFCGKKKSVEEKDSVKSVNFGNFIPPIGNFIPIPRLEILEEKKIN